MPPQCRISSKNVSCEYCSEMFINRSLLKAHCRLRHGDAPLVCAVCNRQMNDATNLRRHVKLQHQTDAVKFTLCLVPGCGHVNKRNDNFWDRHMKGVHRVVPERKQQWKAVRREFDTAEAAQAELTRLRGLLDPRHAQQDLDILKEPLPCAPRDFRYDSVRDQDARAVLDAVEAIEAGAYVNPSLPASLTGGLPTSPSVESVASEAMDIPTPPVPPQSMLEPGDVDEDLLLEESSTARWWEQQTALQTTSFSGGVGPTTPTPLGPSTAFKNPYGLDPTLPQMPEDWSFI